MPFQVTIIRTSDGARAVYTDPGDWGEGAEFRWTEGNQACDCNRHSMFHEARGEDWDDVGCSDGRYSVELPQPTPEMLANRL